MAAVTEAHLGDALITSYQDGLESVRANFTDFNTPVWETASLMGNGRTEKMRNYDGSSMYSQVDISSLVSLASGIIHIIIKPNFDPTFGTSSYIMDALRTSDNSGIRMLFSQSIDDWEAAMWINGSAVQAQTAGESWSANDVIDMIVLYQESGGLDSGNSLELYIDGVLAASSNTGWTAGVYAPSNGTNHAASRNPHLYFSGGEFAGSYLSYSSLTGNGYTDAEIITALFTNTLGPAAAHLFEFEATPTPAVTPIVQNRNIKKRLLARGLM